jgi:hypothetical protein
MKLTKSLAEEILKTKPYNFDQVTELEIEGLEVLFNNPTVLINFNNVRQIPANVFNYFSNYKSIQTLGLDGLTQIDDADAEVLSKLNNSISLNGLESISEKSALHFSNRNKGTDNTLYLDGLKNTTAAVFDNITKIKTPLSLNGFETLSELFAKSLVKNHKDYVSLNGVKSITAEVAKILKKFKGFLYLNGLNELDEETSEQLIKYVGRSLSLSKIAENVFNKSIFLEVDKEDNPLIYVLKRRTLNNWIYIYAIGKSGGNTFSEFLCKYQKQNTDFEIYSSNTVPNGNWESCYLNDTEIKTDKLALDENDNNIIKEIMDYSKRNWIIYGDNFSIITDNKKLIKKNIFQSPYWDKEGSKILQILSKKWMISYRW